jgi:hypothetical protein
MPIAAVITHAATVNHTTYDLCLWVATEIAPNNGIDTTTSADEMLLPSATIVFDACRSETSHTAKYSVAMFMEKMVFAKS